MFSKTKVGDAPADDQDAKSDGSGDPKPSTPTASASSAPSAPKAKPAPSILSSDLQVNGNMETSGDVQVEGRVDGDIRAHLLTVGEGATVKGEIVADDVIVNGRVIGRVRGLKVRLTSTARVEGDVIHKTIAIESGAHFEGSVQRQDDPLNGPAKDGNKPASAKA